MFSPRFQDTVVVAAANGWDAVQMADRQLAVHLSKSVPVLFVDPASSVVSRTRRAGVRAAFSGQRLDILGESLAVLRPEALPGLTKPGMTAINSSLIAHQIRQSVARLNGSVRATIEANVLVPVMGKLGGDKKVYWAQDDLVGMAPLVGMSAAAFAKAEESLTRKADLVIVANPEVAKTIEGRGRTPVLIPFGCDFDLFSSAQTAELARDIRLSDPIAVFMGFVGDRIDLAMLERVAASGMSLLIIGKHHRGSNFEQFRRLLSSDNVQWLGERPFRDLPRYLRRGAVGIVPYSHSQFNIGSFPLKTLEYLAAGLPVVATGLPAIRWLNSPDISIADDPDGFAAEVFRVGNQRRNAPEDARRRAFAELHSWDARAKAFAEALDLHS